MDIKSPLLILLEMLGGLIENFVSSFQLVFSKMVELFITLDKISGLGIPGFIIAILTGSVVGFLVIKFVFGTSKELIYISLFYFMMLILLSISLASI
ncbi:MAG: hypothetical protein ABIE55_00015 [Candidatus Aenigmatarchaeota archaeon]